MELGALGFVVEREFCCGFGGSSYLGVFSLPVERAHFFAVFEEFFVCSGVGAVVAFCS